MSSFTLSSIKADRLVNISLDSDIIAHFCTEVIRQAADFIMSDGGETFSRESKFMTGNKISPTGTFGRYSVKFAVLAKA